MSKIRPLTSVIFFLCAGTLAYGQQLPAEIAAGYKAGFTCSAVFHAGRSIDQILEDELGGDDPRLQGTPNPIVDYQHKAVTCIYDPSKPPRVAVFREGLGTLLLPPGATIADANYFPEVDIPISARDPESVPWPDGDLMPNEPAPSEVDLDKLNEAIETAFTGEKYQPSKTLGVAVVYKGRLIGERYRPGWDKYTQYRTWSTAKSITNAVVGIMVGKGKLDVNQPAPISEWQDAADPRREITIENLLHMSSGLKSKGAQTLTAYWNGIDTARDAADSELEAEPGTRWKYSNYDTLLLIKSVKETIDDFETYLTFPRRELLNKIGMDHTFPETDPYGNFILSSQVYTTPRDLARFGMLYLNDGVWQGERILPEGWVDYTTTPAPANEDGRYGKQFWLIGVDPRIPDDAYTTSGARGQHTTIVPSKDLVVVRTGLDPFQGANWDQAEFLKDIIAAIE